MKSKFFQTFIFLILLIVTVLSQAKVAFPVVPGWHTKVYPPNYKLVIGLIILSLLFVTIGYTYFSNKKKPIGSAIFIPHLLLTVPLIISLFYPFKNIDNVIASKDEFHKLLTQEVWLEYLLFSLFIIGQLIFIIYFIKHFSIKNKSK